MFLHGVRLFLAEADPSEPLHELVNELLLSPMGRRDWPLRFYSRERLFSVEARRSFVAPDLAALALSVHARRPSEGWQHESSFRTGGPVVGLPAAIVPCTGGAAPLAQRRKAPPTRGSRRSTTAMRHGTRRNPSIRGCRGEIQADRASADGRSRVPATPRGASAGAAEQLNAIPARNCRRTSRSMPRCSGRCSRMRIAERVSACGKCRSTATARSGPISIRDRARRCRRIPALHRADARHPALFRRADRQHARRAGARLQRAASDPRRPRRVDLGVPRRRSAKSTFYKPFETMPRTMPAAEQAQLQGRGARGDPAGSAARLSQAAATSIANRISAEDADDDLGPRPARRRRFLPGADSRIYDDRPDARGNPPARPQGSRAIDAEMRKTMREAGSRARSRSS